MSSFQKSLQKTCCGIIDLDKVSSQKLKELFNDARMKLIAANSILSATNNDLESLDAEVLGFSKDDYKNTLDLLEGIESEKVAVETIESNIKKLSV